jgi:hypothetical protein
MKLTDEPRIPNILLGQLEEALQIEEPPKRREALKKAVYWDDSSAPFRHIIFHMGSEESYYNNERARGILSDVLVQLADKSVDFHTLFSQLLEFVPSGKESYMIKTATRILTKNYQLYENKGVMDLIREKTISLVKRGPTNYPFKQNTAELLGEVGGRESVEIVISFMRKLRDLPTLYACIDALAKIGNDSPGSAISALEKMRKTHSDHTAIRKAGDAINAILISIPSTHRSDSKEELWNKLRPVLEAEGLNWWNLFWVKGVIKDENITATKQLKFTAAERLPRFFAKKRWTKVLRAIPKMEKEKAKA